MKRLVITGGTGFIGRHLLKILLDINPTSVAVISNSDVITDKQLKGIKLKKDTPIQFFVADVRDRKAISDIFKKEKADTCVHLAAKISVADSIKNPEETMDINANGTLNVLQACYESGVNNFIFASSAAVYGDVKKLPISESQVLEPLSPYGTSKMIAEQHVLDYQKSNKIQNTISLRIFNVYGAGQSGEADVITRFASRLSRGLPPIIYGDGAQTRDFISVDDVARSVLLSIRTIANQYGDIKDKLKIPAVFNIGSGIPTRIQDLACKMIKLFNLDVEPILLQQKEGTGAILHSYADMARTRRFLNFVPKKGIDAGIREIIEAKLEK